MMEDTIAEPQEIIEQLEREIEERKKAEEALQASEETLENILQSSPDSITVTDLNGIITECNLTTLNVHGFTTKKEIIGSNSIDLVAPKDRERAMENAAKVLKQGCLNNIEMTLLKNNGDEFPAEVSISVIRDSTGKPTAFIGITKDITERKRTEEVLKAAKDFSENLIETANVIVLTLDINANISTFNKHAEELTGYKKKEVLGKNWFNIFIPERDKKIIPGVFRDALGQMPDVSTYENPIVIKKGEERLIRWSNNVIKDSDGEITGLLSIGRDITERKQAEDKLKEAFNIINSSPAVAFRWKNDEGWPVEYVSENVENIFGYTVKEFTSGKVSYASVIHPDDLERVAREVSAYSSEKGRKRFIHKPYRIISKNGNIKWVDDKTFIRKDEKGTITHYQGIVENTTERKLAEEELQRTKDNLETLFRSIDDSIIVVDPSYKIIRANDKAVKYLKADSDKKLIGRKCYEAFYNGKNVCPNCSVEKAFETGKPVHMIKYNSEIEKFVLISASPVFNTKGEIVEVIEVARDVTDMKLAQEKIKSSLKEKEILLEEVHHRVKNNLQLISSLLNLQSQESGNKSPAEILKESQDRVRSMALIHEKLYQSEDFSNIDWNDYITTLTHNLRHSYRSNPDDITLKVTIENVSLDIDSAIPCALIINELVSNAFKYAFPEGGKGEICIEMQRLNEEKVLLVVRDNGIGVPEDLDIHNTRSLGLQIINTLADQLGSRIKLHRNGGTEFRMTLTDRVCEKEV